MGEFTLYQESWYHGVFAIIMLVASISMIRDKRSNEQSDALVVSYNYPLLYLKGSLLGAYGYRCAGGGF